MAKTEFDNYIADEVSKLKGVYMPVKAGLLERLFKKRLHMNKLHPNPDDEFAFPDIGPYYEIVSGYEKAIRHQKEVQRDNKTILPQKVPSRYHIALYVDDESVICSYGREYGFEAFQLDADDDNWKEKVIERAEEVKRKRGV